MLTTMIRLSGLLLAATLLLSTSACARAVTPAVLSLKPDAPQCKAPTAKPPKLGVHFAYDAPTEIKADFNGDGWCDYALGVPYPINSKMNSYYLNQLMVLGGASGWQPVLNGKSPTIFSEKGYAHETWPIDRVDLTDIRLVFPNSSGAPFVLGLFAGGLDQNKHDMVTGCHQYRSVHRWDPAMGAFKKVDDTTRDAVLKYFYSAIEKPCSTKK